MSRSITRRQLHTLHTANSESELADMLLVLGITVWHDSSRKIKRKCKACGQVFLIWPQQRKTTFDCESCRVVRKRMGTKQRLRRFRARRRAEDA